MGGIPSRVLAVLFLGILIASGIRLAIDSVGRYTNGSAIVDGQEVGVAGFTRPNLSPDSMLQGVNYASGGILNETSKMFSFVAG